MGEVMDAIVILGFGLAGVTLVLTAWTVINRNKAETENDALTRAVLRLYDRQKALENEVMQLRAELIQLQTNDQVTKKAPPRPVPPKKYEPETDSWLDIPVVATAATATALGAAAIGAWAMPTDSGSSDSWDCGDSFDCGGE